MSPACLLLLCSSLSLVAAAITVDEQVSGSCSPMTCGNLTISHPFGFVPEQETDTKCGRLGFEVHCSNNTPYLGYYRRKYRFRVLDIFYGNRSLLVADVHKLEDFKNSSSKGCHVMTTNTSSKVWLPFSVSPVNLNLIFYHCTAEMAAVAAARRDSGFVVTKCGGGNTLVRVGGHYNDSSSYEQYSVEGCGATLVPVLRPSSGEANASSYEELISDGFLLTWQPPSGKSTRSRLKLILIVSLSATTSLILTCLVWITCRQKEKGSLFTLQKYVANESRIEELLKRYDSLAPKRYSYSELKKITKSFKDKLGEGGYGMVFKGILQDGRMVAVKLLTGTKGNGEEFLNEVISIGRTSHVNIVSLLGFCLQGSKRALVYEYMANGSLDKYIYSEESKIDIGWEKMRHIAIGIARGLEYLHCRCNTHIIHFDIKPQNILLDEDFGPKVADFGLAKLCRLNGSALSMVEARGTVGFIAPEVFSRGFGVVSTKSDVYSYGMLLLELVGGRRHVNETTSHSSETYFPNRIYDCLVNALQTHAFMTEAEEITKLMTIVGLWCIQTNPGNRPSISRVIEMLEKKFDELEVPPKPFLS